MVKINSTTATKKMIVGCSYIQNDGIFIIGVVQIKHTGMSKLGYGKRISWINFSLQCRYTHTPTVIKSVS